MTTPPDDQSNAYEEALDIYDEHIGLSIGLCLKKRPSEKQKAAIVDLIIRSYEEENFDFDVILEQYARNCLEPLYLTDPELFSEVQGILSAFLPSDHGEFRELELNDEDPPLHIGQLLKKPSVEQLSKVVKALQEDDPKWNFSRFDFDPSLARRLVLVLGNNFPELIKQNSRTRIIFENLFQNAANGSSPPLVKAKGKKSSNVHEIQKKGKGCLIMLSLPFAILTTIIYLFR